MIQKYLLEQTVTNIISFLEYDSVREILTEREREKLRSEAGCVTPPVPTTDSAGKQQVLQLRLQSLWSIPLMKWVRTITFIIQVTCQ